MKKKQTQNFLLNKHSSILLGNNTQWFRLRHMLRQKKFYNAINKKDPFNNGYLHYKLYITNAKNNWFLTVVSDKGKVKLCYTGGTVGYFSSDKKKLECLELLVDVIGCIFAKKKRLIFSVIFKSTFFQNFAYIRSVLRILYSWKLRILRVTAKYPIAHNGCRLKKKRRL